VAAFCSFRRIDEAGHLLDEAPPGRFAMTKRWIRSMPDHEAITPFETLYAWSGTAMDGTTMFRRGPFDAAGGWEEAHRRGGAFIDLICRAALLGPVLYEPERLYYYRRRDGQLSANVGNLNEEARSTREAWKRTASEDESVRPAVERAEFFVEHRLAPRLGFDAAARLCRGGSPLAATRFFGGAVRRYRWRAFPEVTP
jgi:hypothetical protein